MKGYSFLSFTGGPGRGLVSWGLMGGAAEFPVLLVVVCLNGQAQLLALTSGAVQSDAIVSGIVKADALIVGKTETEHPTVSGVVQTDAKLTGPVLQSC